MASPSCSTAESANWNKLALAEERFLFQRSRVTWLRVGDCNSPLFHHAMCYRRSSIQIHYLLDKHNQRIESTTGIQSHCVDFLV